MLTYIKAQSIVFGPEEVIILVAAFDEASQSVLANLSDQQDGDAERTREILAKRIIQLAELGERNQTRLCTGALDSLAMTLLSAPSAPPRAPEP
jgi:hypothetical protein